MAGVLSLVCWLRGCSILLDQVGIQVHRWLTFCCQPLVVIPHAIGRREIVWRQSTSMGDLGEILVPCVADFRLCLFGMTHQGWLARLSVLSDKLKPVVV